jgi:hypothetical protein
MTALGARGGFCGGEEERRAAARADDLLVLMLLHALSWVGDA